MFEGLGLFFGALADALIGPNLLIPGEPFFIAAGYSAYAGAWSGVVMVMLGGLLGDQLSYFIGHRWGTPAQKKLIKFKPKTKRLIARCRYLMAKKGNYIILFARLLGPIAWVVPFIAGAHRVKWHSFSFYALIGLVLGGGQFIVWGALLAHGVEHFPLLNEVATFINEHLSMLLGCVSIVLFGVVGYRYKWRYLALKVSALLLIWVSYTNYAHFFWKADDFQTDTVTTQTEEVTKDVLQLNDIVYKAFPGKSSFYDAQAVNVVYIGESPRDLMTSLGWIENQTFSRNDIEWGQYLNLLKENTPPVSDLYWQDKPQDMAFQLPGDLIERSHIRWWDAGIDSRTQQSRWLGAISYDDGLKVTPYSGIVTVLHNIDPNVDQERDRLAEQIEATYPNMVIQQRPLASVQAMNDDHDYYTDGNILLIDPSLTDSTQRPLYLVSIE